MNSQEKISSERSDSQPSSVGDSLANLTALQENVKRLLMNVISQENSSVSFGRLNPDGSLLKMSQGSVQANLEGFLENSFMTFPKWGILSGGVAGELLILEPRTEENGSLLLLSTPTASDGAQGEVVGKNDKYRQLPSGRWRKITQNGVDGSCGLAREIMMLPTCRSRESGNYQYANGDHEKPVLTLSGMIAMLPTPTKSDCTGGIPPNNGKYRIQKNGTKWGMKLNQKIAMLPTPTSRDHKDAGNLENVPENALLGRVLGKRHGLKLQPAFAEWMMGFPPEWTALSASEMQLYLPRCSPSCRSSRKLKGAKSDGK